MLHPVEPTLSPIVAIGIDVGGTWTRVAAVDRSGQMLARRRSATDREGPADRFGKRLADHVVAVLGEIGWDGVSCLPVGLALPGTLSHDRRFVIRSVHLPFLEGQPVIDNLARWIGALVPLSGGLHGHTDAARQDQQHLRPRNLFTDAEAATWGEYVSRTPKPQRFAHLRLGTGVACGLVIDDTLLRLDTDRSTHLDILRVDDTPAAPPCP